LSAYLRQLNEAVERDRARGDAQKAAELEAEARAARERLTPLDERVAKLLATIPLDVQREGLALATLQTMLKGRRRGNCHPGELGDALRKLGFVRRRRWGCIDGFCARWYPFET
jgi:hypothetical protein